jgi:hypothetical protein
VIEFVAPVASAVTVIVSMWGMLRRVGNGYVRREVFEEHVKTMTAHMDWIQRELGYVRDELVRQGERLDKLYNKRD